jgi:hypothetical protein
MTTRYQRGNQNRKSKDRQYNDHKSSVLLWSLYCLSFDLRFWFPLWYLVVIVLSVLWFTDSGYPFGILWSLYCLSFDLRFWLPLWYLVVIVLSVLWFTDSGYPFGILWALYCLSFEFQILVIPLVSCGHCIVCPLIYRFWLPLWYLVVIVLSVLRFTILVTPLVSCGHCVVCPVIYDSGYPFGILWSLYCLSFDLRFCLPLWYLVVIVLSVLRFTILVTPLVSCGHCIVCPLMTDNTMTTRYQRGNQNRKSKDRQYKDQKIPKGKAET